MNGTDPCCIKVVRWLHNYIEDNVLYPKAEPSSPRATRENCWTASFVFRVDLDLSEAEHKVWHNSNRRTPPATGSISFFFSSFPAFPPGSSFCLPIGKGKRYRE